MSENISLALIKLIYDYLKRNKPIDNSFVEKVVDIVVNELDLNYYVKDVIINNNPWNGKDKLRAATYYYTTRKLSVELQSIIEQFTSDANYDSLSSLEKLALIYDRVMCVILHELEHANQMKKANSKEIKLENTIIQLSSLHALTATSSYWFDKFLNAGYSERDIYNFSEKQKELYKQYWKYAPIERLAEYYSHKTMATVFKEIATLPGISYYECLKLCENYLIGYQEGLVPTKFYLDMLGFSSMFDELIKKENLDFETRASLGLPITDDEYSYLNDTTNDLRMLLLS